MALFFLLFVIVPILELYVIIQVGQEIGALWTILILIVDSLVGARLSWQGRRAWQSFSWRSARVGPTGRYSTAH